MGTPNSRELTRIADLVEQEAMRMVTKAGYVTISQAEFDGLQRQISQLMQKVNRQAKEVERLTGRVVAQRLALRQLNDAGRTSRNLTFEGHRVTWYPNVSMTVFHAYVKGAALGDASICGKAHLGVTRSSTSSTRNCSYCSKLLDIQ